MTTKAYIETDWMRDELRIGIARDRDGGALREVFAWGPPTVRVVDLTGPAETPLHDDELRLPEDVARALYEALGDHFGHAGHDMRALRKDYDAERKRVDLLIEKVTK